MFLDSQSIHNSQLKSLLRHKDFDHMSNMTTLAISSRETSMLRSKEKANEFCSFICAHRLLDVIAHLSIDSEPLLDNPPVHKKMGINFTKSDVRIHLKPYQLLLIISRMLYVHLETGRRFHKNFVKISDHPKESLKEM